MSASVAPATAVSQHAVWRQALWGQALSGHALPGLGFRRRTDQGA
jgi:hypothetical protein